MAGWVWWAGSKAGVADQWVRGGREMAGDGRRWEEMGVSNGLVDVEGTGRGLRGEMVA